MGHSLLCSVVKKAPIQNSHQGSPKEKCLSEKHGKGQSLEAGAWERRGGGSIRVSISCCLTATQTGLKNIDISQPDHAQHGRGSFVWIRGWDRAALGFPFYSELFSAALTAWRLHICHQQGIILLLKCCLPRCPIIFRQNLARLVGPPMISEQEKWGQRTLWRPGWDSFDWM